LEVGAGFGQLLSLLKKEFSESAFFATELDAKCLSKLSDLGVKVKRVLIDAGVDNPFDTDFDLILCSHVMEHSPNPGGFLACLSQMLRPGGHVFVEVPNCGVPYYWGEGDFPHLVFFSRHSLMKIFENTGLPVKECYIAGPGAVNYVSPTLFRKTNIGSLVTEVKNFVREVLPDDIRDNLTRFVGRLKRRHKKNAERSALLMMHDELIEKEYERLFFQPNPDGIVLRIFGSKEQK